MSPEDQADLDLLGLANEKGRFALDLRGVNDPRIQAAFERGIDARWFDFVDLSYDLAYAPPGRLMRVFRLTEAGSLRLKRLRAPGAAT